MYAVILDGVTTDDLEIAVRQCGFDPYMVGVRATADRPAVTVRHMAFSADLPELVGTSVICLQWESAPYTRDGGYDWGRGSIHFRDLIRVDRDITGYLPSEIRAILEQAIAA